MWYKDLELIYIIKFPVEQILIVKFIAVFSNPVLKKITTNLISTLIV